MVTIGIALNGRSLNGQRARVGYAALIAYCVCQRSGQIAWHASRCYGDDAIPQVGDDFAVNQREFVADTDLCPIQVCQRQGFALADVIIGQQVDGNLLSFGSHAQQVIFRNSHRKNRCPQQNRR